MEYRYSEILGKIMPYIFFLLIPAFLDNTNQTDYLPLIIGILTFIGVLFNGFLLYRIQKITRINRYYDKILDKRIHAYELLENLLQILFIKTEVKLESGDVKTAHSFFSDYRSFSNFREKTNEVTRNSLWFSEKLTVEVVNFSNKLFELDGKCFPNNKYSYILTGVENYSLFVNYYLRLRTLHMEDLQTLYKVKEFLEKHHRLLSKIEHLK